VSAQFVKVILDFVDMQVQDTNFTRLKESIKDADYYMCGDNGLIYSSIERKLKSLAVF
jgi:hypothetical protein